MIYTKKKILQPLRCLNISWLPTCEVARSLFKRSRRVWVCLLFYSTFPFRASQVRCLCTEVWFIHPALSCFCQDGGCERWPWGPTRVRRSPGEANVSPRFLSLARNCSLLWVLLHADGRFGPHCVTGKHSCPPLCQSTESTNKTPQVLLVVCCNPVHVWFHLPALLSREHFFPSLFQASWRRAICSSAPLPPCHWLVPPHVVGDALADVGAVVEIRRAHGPGISASQPVAAREEEDEGGRRDGEPDKVRSRREARWK